MIIAAYPQVRTELDAYCAHLYGLTRDELNRAPLSHLGWDY